MISKASILEYFQGDYKPFYQRFIPEMKPIAGNENLCLCPFHEDHNPSLNINSVTGLFKCHGCGAAGDIFSFYGKLKGLSSDNGGFPAILEGIAKDFDISEAKREKRIVTTYDYTDATGTLLYQVIRFEPKDFRQRRPDGRGGFIWNLQGINPVLFHLLDVLRADQVLIVEGEKDVDNLMNLGFTATCNSGGAGKWKDEYSDYLTRKAVIIIPDQDEPGRKHGEQVARSLQGKARSIKMLELPGVKDVSDFINSYGDSDAAAERLCIMIDGAKAWEPKESESVLSFPSHIITGVAGHFATVLSEVMEPPKHFFFMAYLACLGSILSGRITLKSELNPQPRLFMVLLGESADDRKSTAISKTVSFFQDVLTEFHACFGVNSAEGLQGRFSKGDSLLLVFDELKAFVGKAKMEGSVLLPCVCTLFEFNHYESHTKKDHILLTNAHLSILAASTVATYERCWDSNFQDIGMTNRLFIVPGEGKRAYAIPKQIDAASKDELKAELVQVLRSAALIPELDVNPDALTLYEKWYLNLEQSVHTKRLDTYALRLMILLAVNAQKHEIDESVIKDTIDLISWQLEVR